MVSQAQMLAGGESGQAYVPRQPEASLLIQRIIDGEMPPPKQGKSQKLAAKEIATLRAWIDAGAVWPEGRQIDLYETTTDTAGNFTLTGVTAGAWELSVKSGAATASKTITVTTNQTTPGDMTL